MDENELEALRQKRLAELQAQAQQEQFAQAHDQQQAQTEGLKQIMLRRILTTEAKARLGRLKMAHPQEAAMLENQLLGLAQSGQLRSLIDEDTLRQIMARLKPPQREIKITRR